MPVEVRKQPKTIREWLRHAVTHFDEAGLSFGHGTTNARDEAAYLILHTLKLPLDRLDPFLDRTLSTQETDAVSRVLRRRIEQRVPAAYLTNEAWLGDYRFYVDERVIVPRSFIAELLRDELSPWVKDAESIGAALDLCTGSGCLAILLTQAFPNARVDATELSSDALEVAGKNVSDYGLEDRICLVRGDLFAGMPGPYQLIVSNPPYVKADSMAALPPEYRAEPQLALAGGKDGLDVVRRILSGAGALLDKDGLLVVEIGHNRNSLERAFPRLPFTWLETSAGDGFVFLLTGSQLAR
ncbi:MAG TPA: 50S ribosomal protein L3 N(5)-glutamine methyltransferase [Burkholderiales bacterium]|nr:50S ribosomal protein L3 N(5)-glutamine methyltransferase [Burkholderiales bacterium]